MLSFFDCLRSSDKTVTGVPIFTVNLKSLIDSCVSDERAIPIIEALNKAVPLASNYLIYLPNHPKFDDAKVSEISISRWYQSRVPIAQHIKLKDLQSNCKLMLSEEQANYMRQLETLNIKLTSPATPNP